MEFSDNNIVNLPSEILKHIYDFTNKKRTDAVAWPTVCKYFYNISNMDRPLSLLVTKKFTSTVKEIENKEGSELPNTERSKAPNTEAGKAITLIPEPPGFTILSKEFNLHPYDQTQDQKYEYKLNTPSGYALSISKAHPPVLFNNKIIVTFEHGRERKYITQIYNILNDKDEQIDIPLETIPACIMKNFLLQLLIYKHNFILRVCLFSGEKYEIELFNTKTGEQKIIKLEAPRPERNNLFLTKRPERKNFILTENRIVYFSHDKITIINIDDLEKLEIKRDTSYNIIDKKCNEEYLILTLKKKHENTYRGMIFDLQSKRLVFDQELEMKPFCECIFDLYFSKKIEECEMKFTFKNESQTIINTFSLPKESEETEKEIDFFKDNC